MLLVVLLVLIELPHDSLITIHTHGDPQWRIFAHTRKFVHSYGRLLRVTALGSIALGHAVLGVDMVVLGQLAVGKGHAAAGPVRAKPARFDDVDMDVPLRLQLMGEGFAETFDGPFTGTVDGEDGDAASIVRWLNYF